MVGKAVEALACEPLGAKLGCPLVEWQIADDQRAAALVALAEDFEQQFDPGWQQRHVTVNSGPSMAGDRRARILDTLYVA